MDAAARWVIAADDRTGALEVAGMCAVGGSGSVVSTDLRTTVSAAVLTIDLASRHVPPDDAAGRATIVEHRSLSPDVRPRPTSGDSDRVGHKVDSLLRGNWAAELLARHRVAGRRVLLVPAFPAMGRTCRSGVVRSHGVPVGELPDARGAARTSRPAGELDAAELGLDRLDGWLRGDGSIAVCDASTDDDLRAIAALLDAHPDVLVAGPAGVLAAAAHGSPTVPPLPLPRPALVVCGSVHPAARRQLVAVERIAGVEVVTHAGSDTCDAEAILTDLAARTSRRLDGIATLVIVGGDTAAALLGPGAITVGGTVAPGMPWCPRVLDRDVQLVTKAGAFGDDGTIARLFGAG